MNRDSRDELPVSFSWAESCLFSEENSLTKINRVHQRNQWTLISAVESLLPGNFHDPDDLAGEVVDRVLCGGCE